MILPLTWPVLHSCPSLFLCLFNAQWYFALEFSQEIYCASISLASSITLPPAFNPTPYCSAFLSLFYCVLFLHWSDVFQYYSLTIIHFFPSSPSPLISSNSPTINVQTLFFWIQFTSLYMMFSSSIHFLLLYGWIIFPCMYVYIYHIFLIHPSIIDHLGCFQSWLLWAML
jgi:hypothetical protein